MSLEEMFGVESVENTDELVNFHMHTADGSNVKQPDAIVPFKEYVRRAVELGHRCVSTCEHGSSGDLLDKFYWKDKCGRLYYTLNGERLFKAIYTNDNKYRMALEAELEPLGATDFELINYNINLLFVNEIYFKADPESKRASHLVVISTDKEGMETVNKVSANVVKNKDGFWGISDLDKLKVETTWISSACFTPGTKVKVLGDTYKNIEDVKSGDFVLTHNNTWEEVLSPTSRIYNGNMYTIGTMESNRLITCTENHKFLTIKDNELVWKEIKDFNIKDILLTPIEDVSYSHIKNLEFKDIIKYKDSMNRPYRKQINTNINITEEFMMTIGMWLADGSMRKTGKDICFTINILEFDNYYKNIIEPGMSPFNINPCINIRKDSNRVDIIYSSVQLWQVFDYLFGDNNKSISKSIPKILKNISDRLNSALLYGYILGDGNFRKRNKNRDMVEITSATISKNLHNDIFDIYKSIGCIPRTNFNKGKIDKHGVNHLDSYYLNIHVYTDNITKDIVNLNSFIECLKNTRYNDNFIEINNKKYIKRFIKSMKVEEVKNLTVHCLNVDRFHSFECENIIVHNCLASPIRCRDESDNHNKVFDFLYNKFGDHLLLEIQANSDLDQLEWNKELLYKSRKYGLDLIAGCDSHYIYENRAILRTIILGARGITYGGEDNMILDYPDRNTLFNRFKQQNIFSDDEINKAINKTLMFVDGTKDLHFDFEIKIPSLYKNPDNEKKEFLDKIYEGIDRLTEDKTEEKKLKYIEEIQMEASVVFKGGMLPYLMTAHKIIKLGQDGVVTVEGKEYRLPAGMKPGIITKSGRGSAGSSLVNNCLEFTTLDRLDSEVPLLFERFISLDRLEAKVMMD